eukprot:TRINITY_DN4655_c0_g1_i1.p3 TRINITY_DN4655_c0_g1~~TRINITY_DN4655_c0_g1_i1.p3  ORF type:complete len:213 (+),score=63.57 TRINITY_DN4655_c0_g1_i1:292-930(+)
MATFSAYLVTLLTFGIRQLCPLCLASAAASATAAAAAWSSTKTDLPSPSRRTTLRAGVAFGLLAAVAHFGTAARTAAGPEVLPGQALYSPPAITTASSPRALAIGRRLGALNARMYGAYWCSHCYGQKQALGAEAFAAVTYVECAADGKDSQRATCRAAGVQGYPTWDIAGTLLPGEKSLGELEAILDAAERGGDVEEAATKAYDALLDSRA